MKNTMKIKTIRRIAGIIAIIAIIGCMVASCDGGGSNPKSLAQQAVKVMEQGMAGKLSEADAEKQSMAIQEKYEKLSEDDKKIYREERDRLMREMTK